MPLFSLFSRRNSHRVLPPVLVELLLGLACERAFGAGVGPLPAVVHLVLLQLPLGPEHLVADAALLGVLGVVDLQVQPERAQLLEALVALRARVHALRRVAVGLWGEKFWF